MPSIKLDMKTFFAANRAMILVVFFAALLQHCSSSSLGSKCQHDMDCTDFIKGSTCSMNGYCECAPYFVQYNVTTCLSSQLLGGDCILADQCTMKVSNSSCLDGACRCVEGFLQFRKHTCLGPAHPGAVCYSHAHCQMNDRRSHCDFLIPNLFGRCQCTSPAKQYGGACVEDDESSNDAFASTSQSTSLKPNITPPPTVFRPIDLISHYESSTYGHPSMITNDFVATSSTENLAEFTKKPELLIEQASEEDMSVDSEAMTGLNNYYISSSTSGPSMETTQAVNSDDYPYKIENEEQTDTNDEIIDQSEENKPLAVMEDAKPVAEDTNENQKLESGVFDEKEEEVGQTPQQEQHHEEAEHIEPLILPDTEQQLQSENEPETEQGSSAEQKPIDQESNNQSHEAQPQTEDNQQNEEEEQTEAIHQIQTEEQSEHESPILAEKQPDFEQQSEVNAQFEVEQQPPSEQHEQSESVGQTNLQSSAEQNIEESTTMKTELEPIKADEQLSPILDHVEDQKYEIQQNQIPEASPALVQPEVHIEQDLVSSQESNDHALNEIENEEFSPTEHTLDQKTEVTESQQSYEENPPSVFEPSGGVAFSESHELPHTVEPGSALEDHTEQNDLELLVQNSQDSMNKENAQTSVESTEQQPNEENYMEESHQRPSSDMHAQEETAVVDEEAEAQVDLFGEMTPSTPSNSIKNNDVPESNIQKDSDHVSEDSVENADKEKEDVSSGLIASEEHSLDHAKPDEESQVSSEEPAVTELGYPNLDEEEAHETNNHEEAIGLPELEKEDGDLLSIKEQELEENKQEKEPLLQMSEESSTEAIEETKIQPETISADSSHNESLVSLENEDIPSADIVKEEAGVESFPEKTEEDNEINTSNESIKVQENLPESAHQTEFDREEDQQEENTSNINQHLDVSSDENKISEIEKEGMDSENVEKEIVHTKIDESQELTEEVPQEPTQAHKTVEDQLQEATQTLAEQEENVDDVKQTLSENSVESITEQASLSEDNKTQLQEQLEKEIKKDILQTESVQSSTHEEGQIQSEKVEQATEIVKEEVQSNEPTEASEVNIEDIDDEQNLQEALPDESDQLAPVVSQAEFSESMLPTETVHKQEDSFDKQTVDTETSSISSNEEIPLEKEGVPITEENSPEQVSEAALEEDLQKVVETSDGYDEASETLLYEEKLPQNTEPFKETKQSEVLKPNLLDLNDRENLIQVNSNEAIFNENHLLELKETPSPQLEEEESIKDAVVENESAEEAIQQVHDLDNIIEGVESSYIINDSNPLAPSDTVPSDIPEPIKGDDTLPINEQSIPNDENTLSKLQETIESDENLETIVDEKPFNEVIDNSSQTEKNNEEEKEIDQEETTVHSESEHSNHETPVHLTFELEDAPLAARPTESQETNETPSEVVANESELASEHVPIVTDSEKMTTPIPVESDYSEIEKFEQFEDHHLVNEPAEDANEGILSEEVLSNTRKPDALDSNMENDLKVAEDSYFNENESILNILSGLIENDEEGSGTTAVPESSTDDLKAEETIHSEHTPDNGVYYPTHLTELLMGTQTVDAAITTPDPMADEQQNVSPDDLPFDLSFVSPNDNEELMSDNLVVETTYATFPESTKEDSVTTEVPDILEITTQTMLGLASRVTLMEPAAPIATTLRPFMSNDDSFSTTPNTPKNVDFLTTSKPVRKRVELGNGPVSLGLNCNNDKQCQLADPFTICNDQGICDCASKTIDAEIKCGADRTGCSAGTFQCRSSGVCISWFFVCDGRPDCTDASDEECTFNARLNQTCPTESFRCENSGRCISRAALCDGRKQCPHGEDEIECDSLRNEGGQCPPNTFRCNSGECLPEYEYCNAIISCKDGSDEPPHLCGSRSVPNIFLRLLTAAVVDGASSKSSSGGINAYCPHRCSNGRCRSTAIVCSGRDGCGDGTDEETCSVCRCPAPAYVRASAEVLAQQPPMPLWK